MSFNIGKYCPVVIDCETTGCDPEKHALLEIALVTLKQEDGGLKPDYKETFHVLPFKGALFDSKSMAIHQIDPYQPLRFAEEEDVVLNKISKIITELVKSHKAQRGILIGHNAWFDLAFLNTAFKRHKIKSPLHLFTSCDTATLSGFILNETVLAKSIYKSKIPYNPKEAHGALYDAQKTAELYCHFANTFQKAIRTKKHK